jgi:hypothetical protein
LVEINIVWQAGDAAEIFREVTRGGNVYASQAPHKFAAQTAFG